MDRIRNMPLPAFIALTGLAGMLYLTGTFVLHHPQIVVLYLAITGGIWWKVDQTLTQRRERKAAEQQAKGEAPALEQQAAPTVAEQVSAYMHGVRDAQQQRGMVIDQSGAVVPRRV